MSPRSPEVHIQVTPPCWGEEGGTEQSPSQGSSRQTSLLPQCFCFLECGRDATSCSVWSNASAKSDRLFIFLVLCSVLTTSSTPATLIPVRKVQMVGNEDVFRMECEPLRCL